ncbi:uncharacterized protein Z518_03933 [Rhinocladiella mackenziei CBS 650.93]|uniref:Uncharacterized protein n=1 Tax=Rhinocladiella mackenziei CBS 650.93 TaxID=1442369 RepID=A0A0D2IJT1_9EURO|nr:uncharacterized protein Z518_03933 [Rhinocladiella mackenziei CBS 650.93]KIX05959.1 hypothetical protein Z518_03933 [Rhinocladiella mackenziei CBS 650.93]
MTNAKPNLMIIQHSAAYSSADGRLGQAYHTINRITTISLERGQNQETCATLVEQQEEEALDAQTTTGISDYYGTLPLAHRGSAEKLRTRWQRSKSYKLFADLKDTITQQYYQGPK